MRARSNYFWLVLLMPFAGCGDEGSEMGPTPFMPVSTPSVQDAGVSTTTTTTPGLPSTMSSDINGQGSATDSSANPMGGDAVINTPANEGVTDGSVDFGPNPRPGEVLITEIMYDPHDGAGLLSDDKDEWIEIYNASSRSLTLEDCILSDIGNTATLGEIALEAGAYLVLARTAEAQLGGAPIAGVFGFALNNNSETLRLECGGSVVDEIRYDTGDGYPRAQGMSLSMDPSLLSNGAAANDNAQGWCLARSFYLETPLQRGTPGVANDGCEAPVDRCALLEPSSLVDVVWRQEVSVLGAVEVQGVTDRSPEVDGAGLVVGQMGFGPDGSDPRNDNNWVWIWASGVRGYMASDAEPGLDHYAVNLYVPQPGRYDFVYRFSADAGRTWTYCDAGMGSTDGFSLDDVGDLLSGPPPDPCTPNPCSVNGPRNYRPPENRCEAGQAVAYPPTTTCSANAETGLPICDWEAAVQRIRCESSEICYYGRCFQEQPRAPTTGEVIISEIMYNPVGEILAEANAEWFEVQNITSETLDMTGCVLADYEAVRGFADRPTVLGPQLIDTTPLVFARSLDASKNGFETLDLGVADRFYFSLTNGGDTIVIRCPDTDLNLVEIDRVSFGGDTDLPETEGASLSFNAYLFEDDAAARFNDEGFAWCVSQTPYFGRDGDVQYGTPGAFNERCDPCDQNPCNDPPAATCEEGDPATGRGSSAVTYALEGATCTSSGIEFECSYSRTVTACQGTEVCLNGICIPEGLRAPSVGDIIVTEIMANPATPLNDHQAEWVELTNVSPDPIHVSDCLFGDQDRLSPLDDFFLEAGAQVVLGRTFDPVLNGGLSVAGLFNAAINNGGDTLRLVCSAVTIDEVTFGSADFPENLSAVAIALDPQFNSSAANDGGRAWCLATTPYVEEPEHLGTPGLPNPGCPAQTP